MEVVQDASSPVPPSDVCIPEGYTDIPMDYFDDFSWRELVAMVWPAASGHRGVADTSKKVGDTGPRVFETYKTLYELFHDDGSAPTAFNQYDPASDERLQGDAGLRRYCAGRRKTASTISGRWVLAN